MRLFPRLLLLGAVLPSVSAAVIFVVGIELVAVAEQQQLDRALLSQAAVEAVSLFDGPDGLHLHMASSPLLKDVAPFAPEAAVYDHNGQRLLHFPDVDHRLPSRWASLPDERTLSTSADGQTRELVLPVQHRAGARYWLVLAGSRAIIEATTTTLLRFAVGSTATLALVLGLLCWWWASRLSRRIASVQHHMQRVARGEFDLPPAVDDGHDEVRALRDAVAGATAELAAQRVARERFIAEAAHELRTPLSSMQLALELAVRRAKRGNAVEQPTSAAIIDLLAALNDAHDETDRLTRLARGLLDMTVARSAPWQQTPVDVVAVVTAALAARADEAGARAVVLRLADREALGIVRGHEPSLRRAIDNLIDNALKHAVASVVVGITAEHGSVEIVVVDDGPGIGDDEVEAVFAPFHHGGDGRGVGLGLAIVQEVARRHGGDAFVVAGPGGRVGFRVRADASAS